MNLPLTAFGPQARLTTTGYDGVTNIAAQAPAFAPLPDSAPTLETDVSVSGVLVLSFVSVGMAIMAMLAVAVTVIGLWWLIAHIPVPPALTHLLAKLHLAKAALH